MPELMRYTIMAEHPSGHLILDVELVASSEQAAVNRTLMTLTHRDQDVAWMKATTTVLGCSPMTRD